jgi:hypothetical protein
MDINEIVGKFALPEAAMIDLPKMALKAQPLMDGVDRLISGHDNGCAFRFETFAEPNELKSKKLHYKKFDTIHICRFFPDRKSESIVRVFPRNEFPESILFIDADTGEIYGKLAEDYKRFLEGKNSIGTALRQWGQLSDAEIASLEFARIYTVEQLVNMPEKIRRAKFGNDFESVYSEAVLWKAAQNVKVNADKAADEMLKLEAEKQEMAARIAALESKLAEMATPKVAPVEEKRGRGRPRKSDAELLQEAASD